METRHIMLQNTAQSPGSATSSAQEFSQQMLARIRSLGVGESFEVDVRGADGKTITGGATITLCGKDGTYGGYIQLKGASSKFYYSGTTEEGYHIAPHRLDADGSISTDVSHAPRLAVKDSALMDRLLGVRSQRRRGYLGNYKMQFSDEGIVTIFYSGENHTDGSHMGAQTFVNGIWRRDGSFAKAKPPNLEDQNRRLADLDAESKRLEAESKRLEQVKKEREQQLRNLKKEQPVARMEILELKGTAGSEDDPLKATVRFELLDPKTGTSTHNMTDTVVGTRLYVSAFRVHFTDSVIQSGEVYGHPTRFRNLYGTRDIPAREPHIQPMPRSPRQQQTTEETEFLRRWTKTPAGETPTWEEFWKLADDSSLLVEYKNDREAFWEEFWRVGNEDAFWELAHDTIRRDMLDIRALDGGGPFINLELVKPGWQYDITRRNLGELGISFPIKPEDDS